MKTNWLFRKHHKIKDETNIYIRQKDANSTACVNTLEIRQFVGILFYMSVIHMPNVRKYWADDIGVTVIKNTMSQKDLN